MTLDPHYAFDLAHAQRENAEWLDDLATERRVDEIIDDDKEFSDFLGATIEIVEATEVILRNLMRGKIDGDEARAELRGLIEGYVQQTEPA